MHRGAQSEDALRSQLAASHVGTPRGEKLSFAQEERVPVRELTKLTCTAPEILSLTPCPNCGGTTGDERLSYQSSMEVSSSFSSIIALRSNSSLPALSS